MRQMTLAHQAEFQRYTKKTRREQFLAEMDAVMPWTELLALVGPYYSKGEIGPQAGRAGHHASGLLSTAVVRAL